MAIIREDGRYGDRLYLHIEPRVGAGHLFVNEIDSELVSISTVTRLHGMWYEAAVMHMNDEEVDALMQILTEIKEKRE